MEGILVMHNFKHLYLFRRRYAWVFQRRRRSGPTGVHPRWRETKSQWPGSEKNHSNVIREKSHVGPSSEHASDDEMALMKGEDSYTVLLLCQLYVHVTCSQA